jgi:prepilin-type N-terminal cleavage/methylation domain-containing protein
MKTTDHHSGHQHGFTLIELSIVLVIVGLITGGILVGRDLIHTAELRSVIKQKEDYESAVNTFRTKYNCLPADCANATAYGFTRNGNGDGVIDDMPGSSYEVEDFWQELQKAGLISFTLDVARCGNNPGGYSCIPGHASPPTKLTWTSARDSSIAGWWIMASPATSDATTQKNIPNNLVITAGLIDNGDGPGVNYAGDPIPPLDAYSIDSKLDDGLPNSGAIRAWSEQDDTTLIDIPTVGAAGANNNNCTTTSNPSKYNIVNTSRAAGSMCSLSMSGSF